MLRLSSGISTISKELVLGSAHHYDWVQLGAALQHPDHGKVFDISQEVDKTMGIDGSSVKIYCSTGYGNHEVLREVIGYEHPDLILLITDPRFFGFVFTMEHELRTKYKIPVGYLNIWDNLIFPFWNSQAYASCDLLFSINRQTKVINEEVLNYHGTPWLDLDEVNAESGKTLLGYLPHGLNPDVFYKQTPQSKDWQDYKKFEDDFRKKNDVDFVVFFNSRNIRRKQPGDIILSFKRFCEQLPKEKANKCCLLMHTQIMDENGTDLMAVKRAICPDYKVIFNQELLGANILNWFHNLADCVFFMSSAEGFGLAANEGLLCGTMLAAPVTGGLQDQMRFEGENGEWLKFNKEFPSNHRGTIKKCGEWALPIFPRARLLQGSIPTPYIFDDVCDAEDAANILLELYNMGKEERDRRGELGRQWVLGEESMMSSPKMCNKFIKNVDTLFEVWKPKPRYEMIKIEERKPIKETGIVW